jgi:hypothetical protein
MPTQTHPIDVPPSRSLIAAFILIVGLGILSFAADLGLRGGDDAVATPAIAELGY